MKLKDPVIGEPLDAIIRVLDGAQGQDISPYEESFLRKSIGKRLAATGIQTVAAYGAYLAAHRAEAEAFGRSLRISYSEFFRDPLAFALLEQLVLPGLIAEQEQSGRGEIRIWSAGCAAGQEAWSVAILLDELTAARDKPVAYRIFATDLSEPDLALAHGGVYGTAAVGNIRLRHLDGCFARQGDGFAVAPRIKARVVFSLYDLLDASTTCPPASIYGNFDLVLCSNVLLYYRMEKQSLILDKLQRCLAPGRYLIAGEAERQIVQNAGGFHAVAPPAAVFKKVFRL